MHMLQFFTCIFLLPYSFSHHCLCLSIMSSLLYTLLSLYTVVIFGKISPFDSKISLMNKFQFFLVICKNSSCMSANLLHECLSSWSYAYGACALYSQDNSSHLHHPKVFQACRLIWHRNESLSDTAQACWTHWSFSFATVTCVTIAINVGNPVWICLRYLQREFQP